MLLRTLIVMLFLPLVALAEGLPAPLSATVNDFADLLPPEAEARVAAVLAAARAETGVHVVLATLGRLPAQGGAVPRIEDHAKTLFNAWGVGDAARDDGILILILRDDREMRIALGSGYDAIWDNAAQRVINRSFLPSFREDRYAEGIERGVAATVELVARPFAKGQPAPPVPAATWADALPFLAFCLFVLVILAMAARRVLSDIVVRLKPCPACRSRGLSRSREVIEVATAAAAGRGMLHTTCASCGWHRDEPFAMARHPKDARSDFGGGGSSGGGATGRW